LGEDDVVVRRMAVVERPVWVQAGALEPPSARRQDLGDGRVQPVAERHAEVAREQEVAAGALSDDDRAALVLHGRRKKIAAAGGGVVDQDDDDAFVGWRPEGRPVLPRDGRKLLDRRIGSARLARLPRADAEREDGARRRDARSEVPGVVKQAAAVAAEIEDDRARVARLSEEARDLAPVVVARLKAVYRNQ